MIFSDYILTWDLDTAHGRVYFADDITQTSIKSQIFTLQKDAIKDECVIQRVIMKVKIMVLFTLIDQNQI